MTALRITENRRPMSTHGAIQPMSKEQARFWQLRKARPEGWWMKRTQPGATQ